MVAVAPPDPVDAIGQRHVRAEGELRIVSLVPSLTELVFDLGLGRHLVGRTGFCVHPREGLREVPKVGGTKDVDLERVRALRPTHLIVNIDENEKPTVEALRADVPVILVTHPVEVEDNLEVYRLFGHVFSCESRAQTLARELETALADVRAARFVPARVLYLIWRRPWMTVCAQTYIARMLATVGLEAVSPPSGQRYPEVDLERFGPDRFDAVLLSSEPYRFTEAHARDLEADPALGGRPVATVDGEMTSWYGSRAIAGLRYLAAFRRALDVRLGLGSIA